MALIFTSSSGIFVKQAPLRLQEYNVYLRFYLSYQYQALANKLIELCKTDG